MVNFLFGDILYGDSFYGDFCEEFCLDLFSMLILVAGAKGEEQMSN